MKIAVAFHECFHDLQFQIGWGEPIIMFLLDMYNELTSEATDGHGDDIGVGYPSFDPWEETEEGIAGEDVVEIFIGEQDDALLFLVDVVYLHQFGWEDDVF